MFPKSYFPATYLASSYFPGNGSTPPVTEQFDIGGAYLHDAFPVLGLESQYDLKKRTG